MPASTSAALTEALFDAAVDPEGWTSVMGLLERQYGNHAGAFYFLDYRARTLRALCIHGISAAYHQSFAECFYTADNPCIRSPELHAPGQVRTDAHIADYFRDSLVLQRSTYYNEWLRPQDLAHTIGTTPLAENGLVLNLSLLRAGDRGHFSRGETRAFALFARQLQRALRVALRLDTLQQGTDLTSQAFDRLAHGIVLLDAQARVVHGNAAAHAILLSGRGLRLRAGRLEATDPGDRQQLAAAVRHCTRHPTEPMPPTLAHLTVRAGDSTALWLSAVPLRSGQGVLAAPRAVVLLVIADSTAQPAAAGIDATCRSHGFTAAETRLARALADAPGLRAAAEQAGLSYETARWYLKILFQKTGTRRQAELVRKLLACGASPLR